MANTQLGYTTLRAPVEGSIAEVDVEPNENVQLGQTVVVLAAGSRPEVEISMPEILIAQIREGDRVNVTFDALPGQSFPARVTEVGFMAGGSATTYPVTVRLEREETDIRPGMAAEVAFTFESADGRERIMVPPGAVGEDSRGRFVFVVEQVADDTGVARRLPVRTGELTGEGLEIVEGLEDGDLLVTAGVHKLVDETRVRLLAPTGGGR
jgi:RND family efflux transporter MFP subunit